MRQDECDGRSDFDFYVGTWNVHHRMLRAWLADSTEWLEFTGRSVMHKILGGMGNLDEITLEREAGQVSGATLRLYNPDTREWSLFWAGSSGSSLLLPMVGKFRDGLGIFYGQEALAGTLVFCRFIWTHADDDHCRWEQAYSPDSGQTWETNWIMNFVRE